MKPNILFFLPDQHRPDFLGGYPGLPVRTPCLDRLRQQGATFSRAFTPCPLCAPARACLAAAQSYARCRVPGNNVDYPLDQPTYYAALRDAGYRVAGVGKFDLHKSTQDWGLDGQYLLQELGFTEGIDNEGKWDAVVSFVKYGRPMGPYMQFLAQRGLAEIHVRDFDRRRNAKGLAHGAHHVTPLPDDAYFDNWIAENGLRFLSGFPAGQPWHLVVNFAGPHDPWDVTESMHARWRNVEFPPPHRSTQFDAATHQGVRRNYAAMIENIDRQVGRMIETVRQRGEMDNTLIVYSSDHGEMLGDHDCWAKCTWRQPSVDIPMIVAGPGVRAGVSSQALVSLQDLAPTFLEYAGVGQLPDCEARSLVPVLSGRTRVHRRRVISALDRWSKWERWSMCCDGRYKLVLTNGAAPILHDMLEDPLENHNIAPQRPDLIERLQHD